MVNFLWPYGEFLTFVFLEVPSKNSFCVSTIICALWIIADTPCSFQCIIVFCVISSFLCPNFGKNLLGKKGRIPKILWNINSAFIVLKVIFDGEEAVDAGGVTKEFFLLLLKELLNPIYGMFTYYQDSNLLWFSDTVS